MNSALRVTGIILCGVLVIADLIFLVPAAFGLVRSSQGKGTRLGLSFADSSSSASAEEIKQIMSLLGARIEKLGIKNAIVEPANIDGEAIQVLLPPGANIEDAKRLLTYVGLVELKLVARGTAVPYGTKNQAEAALRDLEGELNRYEVIRFNPRGGYGDAPKEGWLIVEKTAVVTGADMSAAQASRSQFGGVDYQIDFQLTPEAALRFSRVTASNIGNNIAIVLNNEVRSAPTIQSEISDRGQITGGFTRQTAEDLALVLSTGSLPRPLRVVSERGRY